MLGYKKLSRSLVGIFCFIFLYIKFTAASFFIIGKFGALFQDALWGKIRDQTGGCKRDTLWCRGAPRNAVSAHWHVRNSCGTQNKWFCPNESQNGARKNFCSKTGDHRHCTKMLLPSLRLGVALSRMWQPHFLRTGQPSAFRLAIIYGSQLFYLRGHSHLQCYFLFS